MKFSFYHNNINVFNLEKSLEFYQKALGLTITRERKPVTEVLNWFFWETIPPLTCWN